MPSRAQSVRRSHGDPLCCLLGAIAGAMQPLVSGRPFSSLLYRDLLSAPRSRAAILPLSGSELRSGRPWRLPNKRNPRWEYACLFFLVLSRRASSSSFLNLFHSFWVHLRLRHFILSVRHIRLSGRCWTTAGVIRLATRSGDAAAFKALPKPSVHQVCIAACSGDTCKKC